MADPDQTLVDNEDEAPPDGGLRLLVFSQETVSTLPLPRSGEVVIGRAEDADLRIDLPAISRRHAVVRLGPPISIEDQGSANGTRVRGTTLAQGERVRLAPGDVIEFGSVTAILQRATSASARPRRLWTHGYFEGRLEEECTRAAETGLTFSLVRVRLEGAATPSVAQEALAEAVGPTDVVASYGPGEYEVLLLGGGAPRAQGVCDRLDRELAARGAPVKLGVAVFGRDGKDPDALMAQACAVLPGESAPGHERQIIVKDPQMQRLHEMVQRIASSSISVVLMGETGVGKEVFAEAIHAASPRAAKPFLRLNCAALSETLLESELFGHEKGAFTGAVKTNAGLLETATGGTVLLDEVGELPASIQAKLLRVLEQHEVLRVGGLRPRPIDVRFIAATNRDLETEVKRGNFRQDLFFRLNGISLVIPPLRERVAEIEGLARAFIAQATKQSGRTGEPSLTPEALVLLKGYGWPGNIRELRNVIERAVLLCTTQTLEADLLPAEKLSTPVLSRRADAGPPAANVPQGKDESYDAERSRILDALDKSAGNQTLAAKLLGISRRTMLNRLDSYSIPRPRKQR